MKDLFRCHYCGEQFLGEEISCIMDAGETDEAKGLKLCDGCMEGIFREVMKNMNEKGSVQ